MINYKPKINIFYIIHWLDVLTTISGLDFTTKLVQIGAKQVKLVLWDVLGWERCHPQVPAFATLLEKVNVSVLQLQYA